MQPLEQLDRLKEVLTRISNEASKVIIGQKEIINRAIGVIFTGNHALIEGVPGVGKTLLTRTLARTMDCDFGRIQFTPDLMPADITGTNVFNFHNNSFTLMRGPVFSTFLLADEINRAPAKTQSALLQAMQERQVTIDCETHQLSPFFTVFATQNPIEYEGTYPLPEAQKDRFMMKIDIGYMEEEDEMQLAAATLSGDSPEARLADSAVQPVVTPDELGALRNTLRLITIREELTAYAVQIVRSTRNHDGILVGAGPRATQALLLSARVEAAIDGRDFVTPDDIRALCLPVLSHRLVLRPEYEIEGLNIAEVITSLLKEITVPR